MKRRRCDGILACSLHGDAFRTFWEDHLATRERHILFIVGRGFDVRALDVSQTILSAGAAGRRDLWLLHFDNGLPDSHKESPDGQQE